MTELELQEYLKSMYPQEDTCCEWKEMKNLKNSFAGKEADDGQQSRLAPRLGRPLRRPNAETGFHRPAHRQGSHHQGFGRVSGEIRRVDFYFLVSAKINESQMFYPEKG